MYASAGRLQLLLVWFNGTVIIMCAIAGQLQFFKYSNLVQLQIQLQYAPVQCFCYYYKLPCAVHLQLL